MMLRHHAIALIVIACIAALIAAPLAMWASLPPPDVMDFERWGWCDGFSTAEACDDYVTSGMVFRHFWWLCFGAVFPFLLIPYALWAILHALWRRFSRRKHKDSD